PSGSPTPISQPTHAGSAPGAAAVTGTTAAASPSGPSTAISSSQGPVTVRRTAPARLPGPSGSGASVARVGVALTPRPGRATTRAVRGPTRLPGPGLTTIGRSAPARGGSA